MAETIKKPLSDTALYNRALSLLARSMEGSLAVVGQVSDEWIAQVSEKSVKVADLKKGGKLGHLAGIIENPNVIQPLSVDDFKKYKSEDPDELAKYPADHEGKYIMIHVSELPEKTTVDGKESDRRVNINIIPGFNPEVRQHMVVGNMLLSANLGLDGKERDEAKRPHDIKLVVAAMISDAYGRSDMYTSLLDEEAPVIDEKYIRDQFGEEVWEYVKGINEAKDIFEAEVEKSFAIGKPVDQSGIPEIYHSVIAAKYAAKLQEAAKVAAYGLISNTSAQQDDDLQEKGLGKLGFREREIQIVKREYFFAKSAMGLKGKGRVMDIMREPVMGEDSLFEGVEAALDENTTGAWNALVGIGGKAFEKVRLSMRVERYHPEGFDAFGESMPKQTLYSVAKAAHVVANYHADDRRKGHTAILEHVLLTLNNCVDGLGHLMMRAAAAMTALVHDIREDADVKVNGLNYSIIQSIKDFGIQIAQAIADLTDSIIHGHDAGHKKAAATVAGSIEVIRRFEDGTPDSGRTLIPTDGKRPYTIPTEGVKAADFSASMMELIREPQCMKGGYLAGSGMRIGLAVNNKGFIETHLIPDLARIVTNYDKSLEAAAGDEGLKDKIKNKVLPTGHRVQDLMEGIRERVVYYLQVSDQFMVQNLTIIAGEFGMDPKQRGELIDDFTKMPTEDFQKKYLIGDDAILGKDKFKGNSTSPKANYSSLFTKEGEYRYKGLTEPLSADVVKERHEDFTFLAYKEFAGTRARLRQDLGQPPLGMNDKPLQDVIIRYERKMGQAKKDVGRPDPVAKGGNGASVRHPASLTVQVAVG